MSDQALLICGTLADTMPNDNCSSVIENPQAMFGGPLPPEPVIAHDVFVKKGFCSPSGSRCVAAWNQTTNQYEFIDAEGM